MKHKNLYTKQYRYNLVEKKSNRVSETVMNSSSRMENSSFYTSGEPARKYVPYEYKFYFLLKLWWNIKIWYKRPKVKKNKQTPIISNVLNFFSKFITELVITLIVTIVLSVWGSDIKEFFNK